MDSTQQPFTQRMMARAASVRRIREGSQRGDSNDSRRRMSISQAVGDQFIKIGDVADCSIENGIVSNGGNILTEKNQGCLRKTSLTSSDSLISSRSDLSGLYSKPKHSSSNLTGQLKSNADCKNPQHPTRSFNKYADPRKGVNSQYVVKRIGREMVVKECRNRSNSLTAKLTTSAKFAAKNYEKHKNNEPTNDMNDGMALAGIPKSHKPNKLPRSQGRTMTDAEFMVKQKLNRSVKGADSFDGSKNCLDTTQTVNSTSLNCTGNTTKDSLASSSYTKGFELGNPKWRGPLATACSRPQIKKDLIEPSSRFRNLEEPKLVKVVRKEISAPLKMRPEVKAIDKPDKPEVIAGNVKSSVRNSSTNTRPNELALSVNSEQTGTKKFGIVRENPDSPITPVSAEIKRLEAEINSLEFESRFYIPENGTELSPPDQVYSNSSRISSAPSRCPPMKLTYQSPDSPEKKPAPKSIVGKEKDRRNFGRNSELPSNYWPKSIQSLDESKKTIKNTDDKNLLDIDTKSSPKWTRKNSRIISTAFNQDGSVTVETEDGGFVENDIKMQKAEKFKPNLESTRKSSFTDLSKNTGSPGPRESTVSSANMPPNTSKGFESSGRSPLSPEDKNLTSDFTLPYDIDNFLVDALGDELYNTSVTYPPSENRDASISQFNVSELISQERTPPQMRNQRFSKKMPMTEPSLQRTSTFDRTRTIYRSVTKGIKNKLRPNGLTWSVPRAIPNDSTMNVEDSMCEDKNIKALMEVVKVQETVMYQANKALTVCRSRKEFHGSTEQVESARLFLIAELRKAAALEEIKKLKLKKNDNQLQSYEKGEVTVKDFGLPLKEDILKDEALTRDFVEWFVIAVSQGPTVWATCPVSCPVKGQRIIFTGGILFSDVSPNFKITVGIYSLKMRRTTFNHDDKYHLNQDEKQSRCPSPKRLIRRRTDRTLSPKQGNQIERSPEIGNTSFVLSGMVELYLHDLSLASPWPLTSLLPGSVLSGTIDLKVSCKLHLSVSHSGFLTHGDQLGGHVDWNRRWCVLEGQILKFWNYPCDQEDKEPLATIDLTNCISKVITVADRSICAKPRTFMIETARRRNILDKNSTLLECRLSYTIVRNLLSCDSARDLGQWILKLNQVISALRDWNVTSRSPDVQVSDL